MKINYLFNRVLFRVGLLLLAIALPSLVFAQAPSSSSAGNSSNPAQKDEETKELEKNIKFYIEIGGQLKDVSGARPSKLEEYGQIRKGFLVRRFRIASNPASSADYFRFIGRNASERDQQYLVDFGKYGLYRTRFEWDSNSHLFSRGSRSLFTGEGGILSIDDGIQTTLQNTPDANLPAVVQNLFSNAPSTTLRTTRGTLEFDQALQITKEWSLRFNWTRIDRSGTRPLGSGSYERVGTAAGDTFRVHSIELSQPIDSVTDNIMLGTRFLKKRWGFSFSYTYSNFKNEVPSLTYDNLFRISDFQASSGGAFDRMKMARGIVSLEPSNHSHRFAVSAFVDLARNTRLAGAWSWSSQRQSEAFVPYTLNTAVVTGVPAGLNITSAESLPVSNLDGEVDIFTQDYLIASRPWKNWTFNVRYRRYDDDNKTKHILFPGYVAYVESYWRTNIATVPIENEVQSFVKSNTSAEAIWDINKMFRWKLGYDWEGWTRENRQAAKTSEHRVSTQLTFNPKGLFNSRLSYKYSDRTPGIYRSGLKENASLRMFDQAKLLRHDVDWQWQWAAGRGVGLSGTLGYLSDDYDQNYYGLVRYQQWYGTFDLLYIPNDTTTLYFNYSRENYSNTMQQISKTGAPYAIQNRWNREEEDVLDDFGLGVTTYLMKEKMLLDLHYVFSNARTRITTINLDVPLANSVLNATAFPFPDVKSRFQEVNADLSYQFGNNWGLGMRYIFQPYALDDFAWNQLSPYPINELPAEQTGLRFVTLDSRYTDHNAHIFSVYFRFDR